MDMILTAAYGYGPENVQPFLRSLVSVGYKGRVVILTDLRTSLSPNFEGLDLVLLPRVNMGGRHVNQWRFFVWLDYLRTVPGTEGQVILTDVRDVIFQRNPATLPKDRINGYFEHHGMRIGMCPYNSVWIRDAYGEAVLNRMKDEKIVCAGTIIGSLGGMREYVEELVDRMSQLSGKVGLDQAVHNVAIREDPRAVLHSNGDGVYTVGYVPRDQVQTAPGVVVCNHQVPTIVHQYDRHPDLLRMFR